MAKENEVYLGTKVVEFGVDDIVGKCKVMFVSDYCSGTCAALMGNVR
jgi:hypothetical protein